MNEQTHELVEQYPELRPVVIPTENIHEYNQAQFPAGLGAYEWWQIDAVDSQGNGLSVSIFNGNPFDYTYHYAIKRDRAGLPVVNLRLHPSAYPAVRVAIFKNSRLLSRSFTRWPAGSFSQTHNQNQWSISVGNTRLESAGNGWKLQSTTQPARYGFTSLLNPGSLINAKIQLEIDIQPQFNCLTLQRAAMPDSPSGTTHEWLIACPSAIITGIYTFENRADIRSDNIKIKLENAKGSVNHFWGTGMLGEGLRRWYRSSITWHDGAAIAELPVIRKYIQLAGTLTWYRPDSLPIIMRCAKPHKTDYQRAAWLMAYPLEMSWHDPGTPSFVHHKIKNLNDTSPSTARAFTQATFEIGQRPDEIAFGPDMGIFEILQPARLNWRLWRPWIKMQNPPQS